MQEFMRKVRKMLLTLFVHLVISQLILMCRIECAELPGMYANDASSSADLVESQNEDVQGAGTEPDMATDLQPSFMTDLFSSLVPKLEKGIQWLLSKYIFKNSNSNELGTESESPDKYENPMNAEENNQLPPKPSIFSSVMKWLRGNKRHAE
ncbi:unnamed protein product [Dicrocoelium dendriticum]|nr:unnamed protein product [Dicrocoelium dendriticum]